jgi:hypothetical protein
MKEENVTTDDLLDIVDEFAERQDAATVDADKGSMETAHALDELYERRDWVEEWQQVKPAHPDATGRVAADSRNRFHGWLAWRQEQRGKHAPAPQTLRRLATATRIERVTGAPGRNGSERALRPLGVFLTRHQGDAIPAVWALAVELAGGADLVTSEHVSLARRAWIADHKGESMTAARSSRADLQRSRAMSAVGKLHDVQDVDAMAAFDRWYQAQRDRWGIA